MLYNSRHWFLLGFSSRQPYVIVICSANSFLLIRNDAVNEKHPRNTRTYAASNTEVACDFHCEAIKSEKPWQSPNFYGDFLFWNEKSEHNKVITKFWSQHLIHASTVHRFSAWFKRFHSCLHCRSQNWQFQFDVALCYTHFCCTKERKNKKQCVRIKSNNTTANQVKVQVQCTPDKENSKLVPSICSYIAIEVCVYVCECACVLLYSFVVFFISLVRTQ